MSSTIYHLDAEGEITEYMYGLPVREAFRMAIMQVARKRYDTYNYVNQPISCLVAKDRLVYFFGKNDALFTGRLSND